MPSERFRLTVDGGVPLATNASIDRIAALIASDPDGRRHVRATRDLNLVATFDIARGTVVVTHHGKPIHGPTPQWVSTIRRLVAITHPHMKETSSDQDQDSEA